MGIGRGTFKCLLELTKENSWNGKSVLQLGRQCIYLTFAEIEETAKKFEVSLQKNIPINLSSFEELRAKKFVDDSTFFKLLGFEHVYSTDASDFENPSFVHDLNLPIDDKFQNQFDMIFDGGTLEHIFHFPQCLTNIHKMLKIGGLIAHCSPSNNHVDHGFYMFSPTVFYDYYEANHYGILRSWLIKYSYEMSKKWKVYNYQPGNLDDVSYGGFENEMLAIWFVAEKNASSTCEIIPQQGLYRRAWSTPIKNTQGSEVKKSSFIKAVREIFLFSFYLMLRRKLKRWRYRRILRKKLDPYFRGEY